MSTPRRASLRSPDRRDPGRDADRAERPEQDWRGVAADGSRRPDAPRPPRGSPAGPGGCCATCCAPTAARSSCWWSRW